MSNFMYSLDIKSAGTILAIFKIFGNGNTWVWLKRLSSCGTKKSVIASTRKELWPFKIPFPLSWFGGKT